MPRKTIYNKLRQSWTEKKRYFFYKNMLSANNLCFDIGANCGAKSMVFLKCGAKVIAFEPQKESVENLLKIKNNNLIVESCAIAKESSQREFYISNISEVSTFSKKFMESYKSDRCKWISSQMVNCYSINYFFNKYGIPNYCKIDVEGLEWEIISTINEKIGFIEFENTNVFVDETIKCILHLAEMNYVFKIIRDSDYSFNSQNWLPANCAILKVKDLAARKIHSNIFCKHMV